MDPAEGEGGGDSGDDEDVPPTMERKNHLYKEDVGVDHAEGEGGGDGGDDEDVSPHRREEESPV